jgi:hypothetical protein
MENQKIPIIKITVEGGVVSSVIVSDDLKIDGKYPEVYLCDYDIGDNEGNATDKDGERFTLAIIDPETSTKEEMTKFQKEEDEPQ